MKPFTKILGLALPALLISSSHAVTTFFSTTGAMDSQFQNDIDNPNAATFSSTGTQDGVTFIVTAAVVNNTGLPNSGASSGLGVNAAGGGDNTTMLEPGETLNFNIIFDSTALVVSLVSIDFSNLGGADDAGDVTIGGVTFDLFTGVTTNTGATFDDGTQLLTFDTPITLTSGDNFLFTNPSADAGEGFRIEGVTLDVVSVPEPSSAALLGLGALGLIARRRR